MLWGGRFNSPLGKDTLAYTSSFDTDINLIDEDIQCSIAHAKMLKEKVLISEEEFDEIYAGLNIIKTQYSEGMWKPGNSDFEDIHSAIETKLNELIGPTAGKLHTGRSRNDQVATDMRLWIKKAITQIQSEIRNFQAVLLDTASENIETIIPGYTHLQRAQPVSLAFHFLAYVEMLERDFNRFLFLSHETDISPLGSGALSGSTLPLDNFYSAHELGFSKLANNALDAVSDRDFLLDFLNAVSLGMMHLSRLAEEIILWSSREWQFVVLSDAYSTGSSLMPQKKNPDIAELIRGKTGRAYGNYITLATSLKGLPLSYNRDMQEDKQPVFDSFNIYNSSLEIFPKLISTMQINKHRFEHELQNDFTLATDLADWLVLKGIPFREAHGIVGKVVAYCESNQISFNDLSVENMKSFHPVFDESALECFDLGTALYRKQTHGSTNPDMVRSQIMDWEIKLNSQHEYLLCRY